ncbi:MAG TPA: adenosylcobinamide amidohydrolase [Terriglobia bacterium]|nr:adenosylcobinamide amidohydrolase [Terriglobia bacterium]
MQKPFWKSSTWFSAPTFNTYRQGRFIVAELIAPHRVLTTSSCVGGVSSDIRHLVNHQSCEASGHSERGAEIHKLGLDGYHQSVCEELGLSAEATAVMGTAANMIYAAHEIAEHGELRVDAIVTAGVEGNAVCAGDPAQWIETPAGWNKLTHAAGTINSIVMFNQPLKPEAHIRSLVTITEGKTAALMELGISSRYSQDLATGTGTDQVCVAAPEAKDCYAYSATSQHSKLGELLGLAVRKATKQALRWQNGLEPSHTRSVVHALRRFGFSEAAFLDAMRLRLSEASMSLLEKNRNAVLYEPQVAAAAYAFASVLDRVRFGVIPASTARDVLRYQSATFAASLSTQVEKWYTFWQQLDVCMDRPLDAVYDALASGWTAKWESKG